MAAHLYWRINVSSNNGGSFLSIAEVEMRATVGGADQCNGGTASVSSSAASSGADAFDNDPVTRWSTNAYPSWLQYQFLSPVDVAQYTIQVHNTDGTRAPKDWTFEYSDNGSTWTVADTRVNETGWTAGQIRSYSVAVITNARLSQMALEVLRFPTSVNARVSQIVLEVLRPNVALAPTPTDDQVQRYNVNG